MWIFDYRQRTFSCIIRCGQIPLLLGSSTGGCVHIPQCVSWFIDKKRRIRPFKIPRRHLLKIAQLANKLNYLEGERNCVADSLSRLRLQPKNSAVNSIDNRADVSTCLKKVRQKQCRIKDWSTLHFSSVFGDNEIYRRDNLMHLCSFLLAHRVSSSPVVITCKSTTDYKSLVRACSAMLSPVPPRVASPPTSPIIELRRKTILHCRNGSCIIQLRRLDSGLTWLNAKAEQRYSLTSPLRQHEYSFRLNLSASCSTVCTNWLIQAWKLEWLWSSDHIGGKVLAVMFPNWRRLGKPVKRLKCASIPNRCLNDYLLQANDLVTFTLMSSVRSIRHAKGRTFCLQLLTDGMSGADAFPMTMHGDAANAAAYANVLKRRWIAMWGVPDVITSDRGPQFGSDLWIEICQLMGIARNATTSYHPQHNGKSERPSHKNS